MSVQPLRDHSDKKNETGRKPAFVQQVLSFQSYKKPVTQKDLEEFIPVIVTRIRDRLLVNFFYTILSQEPGTSQGPSSTSLSHGDGSLPDLHL